MAQLRNVLRAYLTDGAGPADALERLDHYMLHSLPGSIATVVCAVLDTRTAALRISHAGHVPALLTVGDRPELVPLDGDPLLGFQATTRTERRYELAAGDSLALYSDGLVETRRLPLDDGLAQLQREAAAVLRRGPAEGRARELASRMLSEHHHDDVTVLLVVRAPTT